MKKRAKGRKKGIANKPENSFSQTKYKKIQKTVAFFLKVCYNNEAVLRNPLKHVGS